MQLDFSSGPPSLRNAQNEDGGWGYRGGASWTEPTAYALLALAAAGEAGDGFARGLAFLRRTQRGDGGWAPHASVEPSTWVTALAVLALVDHPSSAGCERACGWLLEQSGRESGYARRLRQWLVGVRTEENVRHSGWPWYPGTAAWVTPTAFTVLALAKLDRRKPDPRRRERIETGRKFLLDRMCRDGGWNYGSTRALSFDVGSYPETTGLALLALASARGPDLGKSLSLARQQLEACRTAEGRSWLEMALLAHGRSVPPAPPVVPTCRNLMDAALLLLAQASARGRNVFLD